jgi:hypothetical protein
MPKPEKPEKSGSSILQDLFGMTAISQQLAEISIKLDIIIKGGQTTFVIPDLEAAVRKNAALVKRIDEQVPDK